jgi:hypothetical protein
MSTIPPTENRDRRRLLVALAAVLIAAIIIAVIVVASGDDDDNTATTTSTSVTTQSTATSTTTSPTTTSGPTTTTTAPVGRAGAVWPFVASAIRYSDPVAAARGFATEFVGFASPVVGTFEGGATRSGVVDVRARADGPVTEVLVSQFAPDDSWWVIGATTPDILLSEPATMVSISSPVRLRGSSTAFEGTVQTEVRQDGTATPLGSGFVMGGASGELAPFDGTLTFIPPTAASGALVLHTLSAESGAVMQATVVRVNFAATG